MFLIIGFLFISLNIRAQQQAQFHWPLTSPTETAIPSPYATLTFSAGKGVDSLRFSEAFGVMANGWNTDNQDPEAYFEYTLTPAPGTSLEINRLNFEVSLSRVNMRTSVQYSYDGFRMQKTQIGHTIYVATHEPRNLPVKTSLRVTYPQTLSIRIYGWSTVDYLVDFNNRNVVFEGLVYGKDLLAQTTTETPAEPEVQEIPVPDPEELPVVSPEPDPLAAMAVMPPQDTLINGGNNLVRAPMGSQTFNSSGTWTCPAGVNSVTVECWGGGGAGGGNTSYSDGAGGGGGGSYSRSILAVIPGSTYTVTVGNGGAGNNGNGGSGGDSWFQTAGTILARGGNGGNAPVSGNGGIGGNGGAVGIFNQVGYTGGDGGNGRNNNTGRGGGGGSSASSTSNGVDGGDGNSAGPGAGGNDPTDGGDGGNGGNSGQNGFPGNTPGGAGGGAGDRNSIWNDVNGGNGANGRVIITWPDCINPSIFNVTGGGSYCSGGSGLPVELSGSESDVTYQLYRDAVAIGAPVNGTGISLSFGNQTVAGIYTVVATRTVGGCTSNMNGSAIISIITIPDQPSIITGPLSPCDGSSQTYSVTNVSGVSYNWSFPAGWTQTGGGTTNSVTVTVGATGGTITVTPSNTCGNGTARTLTVTTTTVPAQPSAITGEDNPCEGSSETYSVTNVSGVTYNWTFPAGWNQTAGGTTNSVTVTVGANSGDITVTPSNACGDGTARTLSVTVDPLPTPPTSITPSANPVCVNAGGNITLTATGGSGTTLRWFTGSCGGTAIGTGNPLVIASPVTTTTYYARWENSCGNSACASLEVTVTPLPVPPTSAVVDRNYFCADDGGNITLTASGGSGATLQWHSGSCGGTLEGTGTSLTIASPTATTTYYARWVNDCGISTCAEVTVNVLPLPTAPTNASVDRNEFCYDDDGNIVLSATGGSGDELQWFTGSCGGTLIGTGNNLSIASPALTTTYYVRWNSASCGASACTSVTVTVNNVTSGAIAADQTICYGGDPALLTSTTPGTGMGNITYRWESAVSPFTVWNPITGATGATFNPPAGLTETTHYRRVTISDHNGGCESQPTSAVIIIVQSIPTAGTIAEDQYVCFGGSTAPLYSVVDGTGDGDITYRWERSVSPFTVWTTIAGITTAGYNPGPLAFTTQFRRFTVSTLNGVACESVASNIVTITIQDVAVTTGSIGNNQTICNGGIPENLISIVDGTATAGATVTYDWQINNTGAWVDIAGEHGPGLNISTAHTVTTSYRRRTVATLAGNSCVSSWTVAVTITVIQTVTPGSIAASQTICNGSTPAPLTSVTNGSSPGATITYSWEQSTDAGGTWTPIGGATLATYAPGALTQTTWYRRITVATTNGHSCYSVPTNTVIITVQAIVDPGTIAASQTICYNAIPAALTSVTPATGSGTITYQWEFSTNGGGLWQPIAGATEPGYAPAALTQTTWYRRVATSTLNGNACSMASAHVVITVQGQLVAPVVTAAQPTTVCYNTAPGLLTRTNASGGSGTFTYQWQSSIDNVTFTDIGGATGATYQPPALTVTTYYRVMATNNPCGSIYSNVVTITVRPELAAPEICCDQIICTGYSAEPITTIVPPSGGSGSYSYQWMVSADDVTWNIIAGATLSVYTPPTNDRYYRLRITDNICGTVVFSNTVHVYTAFSLSAKFDVAVSPGGPYCPGSSLTVSIESGNITVSNKYIRYSWTADPNFINPATGGPVGNTDCFLWIFCWHWADIPYTVRNTTNATVTTNILITPTVYYNNGTVNCILPTEKVSVTIRPFMLQCPNDIEVNNTPGSCSAQVPIPNIQWVPNSCTSTVNWTLSGATTGTGTGNMGTRTFNLGETTVTYSSTLNGQPTTCSFTVTVVDNQPPTLTCPANITRNTDAGQCTATINVPNPTISDNCGGVGGVTLLTWEMTGATLGNSPVTGVNYVGNRVFNAGVTTITYTAEDAAGNSSTCTFTVTVNDTQAPVFTYCPDDIPVDTDPGVCTATFDPPDPIVVDNCYDLLAVTWAMTGATAGNSPATGINFVGNTTFNPGVTIITYTASDPGGNTATCEFSVSVTDNEAPSFVFCPPGYNQGVDPGECFATIATTNPEPFDNCGIASLTWAMTGATIATSPGTGLNFIGTYSFNVGTTHVVYTLTDNSVPPQTATCTFDVTVTDNIPPTITCPGNQTRSTDLNVCTYTTQGSEFNPTVTDNCTTYTLSNNLTGGPTLAGYVFPIGTTTVQWVVIDAGGNSRQCSFVVTIEDNQAPAITTCAPAQTASANANCQAAVPDVTGMVVVTDNCTQTGYFTITQSPAAGTLVGVGITTITIRVEDENGNAVTCTTSFTVSDNTAPVFADCPTEPRDLGCNPVTLPNEAMAIANAGTVTDNCNANPTVTATGGSISSTGCDRTQTWTVTASDGTNTAQCVVVFEWTQDADLPVITTTAINNDDLGCNPTVTAPAFTGLDNCDGVFDPVVTTAGPTNTGCEYTQTWNANYTDACGNSATEVSITYTWTQDTEAPVISTTASSGALPGCNPTVTAPVFTGLDNCDGVFDPIVTTAGPSNTGCEYTQTWNANYTDACGNPATEVSITYTWTQDTEAPVISTTATSGPLSGCNPTVTAPAFTGLDNCDGVFDPVVTTAGPTNTGCEYTQTWNANYTDACGNPATEVSITYTWTQDTEAPVISTTATSGPLSGCNPTVTAPAFTGLDNCDGVFDPVVTTAGPTNTGCEYTQTWNANYTDACGNPATEVSITYTWTQDNAAPDITCPADQTVTVNSGNVYIHGDNTWDATATDNCSGTVTLEAQLSGVTTTGPHTTLNGVTFNQGLTTVTWTATDECGNTDECFFDVQVDGEADIEVVKTVSPIGAITAGQNITYTLVVTNNGPAVAPEVTLLDNMPAQVVGPTSWTLNGVAQAGTWPESWVFNNMAVGASGQQTIVITGKVDCDIANMFANTATVLLSPPFIDPNTGNNNSTVTNSIVDPVAVSGIVTDGDCESNGAIDITVTGGTPPYTYSWTTPDGVIPAGQEDDEDLTGLASGTYTVEVTDANDCTTTGTWTVTSEDTEPPTFTAPGPFDFCVINIISAQYDGAPEPAADIIPLLPEHGNPRRPDWYLVGSGSTELDLTNILDNCCDLEDISIEWTITFDPLIGGTLSGTGQPSLSTPIQLWGTATNVEVNHTITYTVTDCNTNAAAAISRNILIRPRPNVIKN